MRAPRRPALSFDANAMQWLRWLVSRSRRPSELRKYWQHVAALALAWQNANSSRTVSLGWKQLGEQLPPGHRISTLDALSTADDPALLALFNATNEPGPWPQQRGRWVLLDVRQPTAVMPGPSVVFTAPWSEDVAKASSTAGGSPAPPLVMLDISGGCCRARSPISMRELSSMFYASGAGFEARQHQYWKPERFLAPFTNATVEHE